MENQLETIKKNLPYGYEKRIAEEVGCSQGTVHNVLSGKASSRSGYKAKVMEAAIKLVKENLNAMKEMAEIAEDINKVSHGITG